MTFAKSSTKIRRKRKKSWFSMETIWALVQEQLRYRDDGTVDVRKWAIDILWDSF